MILEHRREESFRSLPPEVKQELVVVGCAAADSRLPIRRVSRVGPIARRFAARHSLLARVDGQHHQENEVCM